MQCRLRFPLRWSSLPRHGHNPIGSSSPSHNRLLRLLRWSRRWWHSVRLGVELRIRGLVEAVMLLKCLNHRLVLDIHLPDIGMRTRYMFIAPLCLSSPFPSSTEAILGSGSISATITSRSSTYQCLWTTAASPHMEDNTAKWLQVYKIKRGLGDWSSFVLAVEEKFGAYDYRKAI
jgi:hypothetical protein